MAAGDPIRKEIFINAAPEHVFPFLIDAEQMVGWLAAQQAEIDASTGGLYRVIFDDVNTARGRFEEVVPNSRVVFTWGWEAADGTPAGPGTSRVEITLEERRGGTFLRLVHEGLEGESAAKHAEGWAYRLDRLVAIAEGRTPVASDPMTAE